MNVRVEPGRALPLVVRLEQETESWAEGGAIERRPVFHDYVKLSVLPRDLRDAVTRAIAVAAAAP